MFGYLKYSVRFRLKWRLSFNSESSPALTAVSCNPAWSQLIALQVLHDFLPKHTHLLAESPGGELFGCWYLSVHRRAGLAGSLTLSAQIDLNIWNRSDLVLNCVFLNLLTYVYCFGQRTPAVLIHNTTAVGVNLSWAQACLAHRVYSTCVLTVSVLCSVRVGERVWIWHVLH